MATHQIRPNTILPGIQPGETPELHRFHSRTFEKLCRDLFAVEPEIASAELWGMPGQQQDGIDIIAHRTGSDGVEVGQCKAYKTFKPHQIRKAADEFVRHLPFWRTKGVRRFVLFVAGEIDSTQCQKVYLDQRQRFGKEGIKFEIWSAPTLVNKLRSRTGIVSSYFDPPEYWVARICGVAAPPPVYIDAPRADYASRVLAEQANELASVLNEDAARKLEAARQAWREGRRSDAFATVRKIREPEAAWRALTPEVKGKIIRFEASVLLRLGGDLEEVRRLAAESELFDASSSGVLRVLIEHAVNGPEAALSLIPDVDDPVLLELRAGLLLEVGRTDESLATVDRLEARVGATAEGYRLRALGSIARNDLPNAQLAALRALEREPQWESVRAMGAMVDYLSALSPAASGNTLPAWPLPVAWVLVKQDDDSIARLRRAQQVFEGLSSGSALDPDELRQYQAWRLACLSNDPERQEQAVEYCRELLGSHPDHLAALWWALNRNFAVDLAPAVALLERQIESTQAGLDQITALVAAYFTNGRVREGSALLEQNRERYIAEGKEESWLAWQSRVEAEESLPASLEGTEESVETRDVPSVSTAADVGDVDGLDNRLERSDAAEHDPLLLFHACVAAARAERWSWVAERAEELVTGLDTAESVRLAVSAAENAGRYTLALSLLDGHLGKFPARRLPPEMRRQRVRVQRALGVLPAAVAEAEELVGEDPSAENLVALASVYESTADLKGLALLARRFLTCKDLPQGNLLWAAKLVRTEDLSLARELWRRATKKNLRPEFLNNAVFLGFELGLDKEASPLLMRLARHGGQGEQSQALRKFVDAQKAEEQTGSYRAGLEAAYVEGMLPVHLASEDLKLSMVELYHQRLELNARTPDPLRQPPLLARHGARTQSASGASDIEKWSLHVDITGLLLAHHLRLLDVIEEACHPLRIAPELSPALLRILADMAHHQPRQVEVARALVDALAQERAAVLDPIRNAPGVQDETAVNEDFGSDLWRRAADVNGYVLQVEPILSEARSGEIDHVSHDFQDRIVTPAALARALREADAISKAELDTLIGSQVVSDAAAAVSLRTGVSIFCPNGTATVLGMMGLLVPACSHFRVYIDPAEAQASRLHVERDKLRTASEAWLTELVVRIRNGLATGRYVVVPMVEDPPEADEDELGEMFGLRTLLEQRINQETVFWVEDRYLGGIQQSLGTRIVGIVDILTALRQSGRLPQLIVYDALDRLRRGNVRFMAPEGSEILYHLRRARVDGDCLVETPELGYLRRYVAATLVQGKILRRDFAADGNPAETNEIPYLISISRAVDEALNGIWSDRTATIAERSARADWLMANLFLDTSSARTVVALRREWENDRHLLATALAGLILQGVTADEETGHEFRTWLTERVLAPRFGADALLSVAVAHVIKFHFADLGNDLGQELESLRHFVRQRVHDRLPAEVREEIERDPEYMANMGVLIQPVVRAGEEMMFQRESFIAAVADAMNGLTARISLAGEEEPTVEISPAEGNPPRSAVFLARSDGRTFVVEDPIFRVLRNSVDDRREVLLQHRDWCVGPAEEFRMEVARVVSMVDPLQRYTEVEAWRDTSPAEHYRELVRKVSTGAPLSLRELMPPDLNRFADYHGLTQVTENGISSADALELFSTALIATEGLFAAVHRLIDLPCELPRAVQKRFVDASDRGRRELLNAIFPISRTPVSCIHLLRLLSLDAHTRSSSKRLARRVALRLLSSANEPEIEAFLALLQWTEQRIREDRTARAWNPAGQLAATWLHAGALFRSFTAAGLKAEWLRQAFDQRGSRLNRGLFERDEDYSLDIAHPSRAQRLLLLMTGLDYAFEGTLLSQDTKLQDAASESAFYLGVPERRPRLEFLQDTALAKNALRSFLGRNRGAAISALTGLDLSGLASAGALRRFAEETVEKLQAGKDEGWAQLWVVSRDLPIHEDLQQKVRDAVLKTDFAKYIRQDRDHGRMALVAAANQSAGWGSAEVSEHLEAALLGIAAHFAGIEGGGDGLDAELEVISDLLLDVALRVAWQQESVVRVAEKFAQLASRIVDAWPYLAGEWAFAAERLWAELPIECARPLASLVVHIRAVRNV
ncbi:hypothetical protein [Longimicrobium terrae]|uniref:HTH domain-containing protein n=1 Tax=Longimicrobium terrae TaxID=1639882 RepID=A0A841H1R3_9BACT|nr:hypothetical protein [Longimicrobium terrae]MBB4637517.1 hypothetical protein [Longimicrobium terrae]MBB6071914.1 hypothetical protein [Longimicrobium terrae]NNC30461.1 hypothetical protein [Longimicrobium terrae]